MNNNDELSYKKPDHIYSKIKRELKSFGVVGLIDESDFPHYTAEVLHQLKRAAYKPTHAVLTIKNGQVKLPADFKSMRAVYKCDGYSYEKCTSELQRETIGYNDYIHEKRYKSNACDISCEGEGTLISRVVVREYVLNGYIDHSYTSVSPISIVGTFDKHIANDYINIQKSAVDQVTISNGYISGNFGDGDIYTQYYAMPYDENGGLLIPNNNAIEKAIEWYIKYQIILNAWLVDDIQNALNKWQKAEQEYEKWMAEVRFNDKLPSFETMLRSLRKMNTINKVTFFSKLDRN